VRVIAKAGATEALPEVKRILAEFRSHDETLRAVEAAAAATRRIAPHHEAIAALGQGWVAEEALAIRLYCALIAESFTNSVVLTVNHDGDSGSAGSITGNLLVAALGVSAIAVEWLEPLGLRDVINEIADDRYGYRTGISLSTAMMKPGASARSTQDIEALCDSMLELVAEKTKTRSTPGEAEVLRSQHF
jgi:ADP-ribosylglycohydrolase